MSKTLNDSLMGGVSLNVTPQPKANRAREPVTRSRGLVRGQFPSSKMNRMVAWESQLEQKACYHFEFSPVVARFREQPETLVFPHKDRMCRYTPDFELTLRNGEILYVEVKPLSKLEDADIYEKLQLAHCFLQGKGYRFIVLTDSELDFPTRIQNLKLLRSYLRIQLSAELITTVRSHLTLNATLSLSELQHVTSSPSAALALIAQLKVHCDLDMPITAETSITQHFLGDDHETCLFTCRTGPNFKCGAIPLSENIAGWVVSTGKEK